ncbi:LytTR family DNA-binding domain-containing protein [Venenivibrio stagnispumantis]|uniref:Two component transcriptional regulator, LytTR family n=1 Tax=Venenivibrio stagnispumantis TaxID=407998 RepID=A0AA46AEM9_9AQUI|nr:LytTR family DNA-binding domain-containing protein [Venenivibrio stagnispumantis]MCW4573627.1 LytTR family DNA-binding domain-containing protein [Venenivibrio stagnispumantis]SMP14222.1 two component transcriptional regulator, LytTR family [Venenivibrio stagnispumantis]
MQVFIVDDEYIARERLKRFLKDIKDVEVVGEAETKKEAVQKIIETEPDIVILDIKLPDGTGLEVAKEIIEKGTKPYIIFATAYGDYALEAFKLNSVDYLLKPYEFEDLEKAIEKVKNLEEKERNFVNVAKVIATDQDFLIPAKTLNKVVLLRPDDIYYIKAELSETLIRTKDKDYLSKRKLYEFEELLSHKGFFKVHKSYIVNLTKIKEMKIVEQSKFLISFKDIPDTIKTSREGAKKLRDYLDI